MTMELYFRRDFVADGAPSAGSGPVWYNGTVRGVRFCDNETAGRHEA
jgi:hypothetical protein